MDINTFKSGFLSDISHSKPSTLLATVGDWRNVFVFVYLCNSVCVFANHTSETGADLRAKVLLSQFFSAAPLVLSLSCPGWSFSMDRIFDASSHAFLHHPTGPSYIKVRNLFWTSFFPRICFSRGAKKSANLNVLQRCISKLIYSRAIHSNF